MRVLLWHVHGSWTTAFVHGGHDYFVPVVPDRGPDGRGRAETWDWPPNVHEVTPDEMADLDVDVVILQRTEELDHLAEDWLGRRPGRDVPAVFLEHNAPQGRVNEMCHPAAGRPGVVVVHVTHFNELFWDCGTTPTRVIEHGIVDPGYRYSGALPRAAVVVNDAARRARVVGSDLLATFAAAAPLDVFGMRSEQIAGTLPAPCAVNDLPQADLHADLARRRVYVHPVRWTSLGLSLLEAMHLGMPVVALATTEVVEAVPAGAGVVSTDVSRLVAAVRDLVGDPESAAVMGKAGREAVLARYGLERFLADWNSLLEEVTR